MHGLLTNWFLCPLINLVLLPFCLSLSHSVIGFSQLCWHKFRIIGTVLGLFSIENNSGIGEFFAIGGVAAWKSECGW